MRSKLFVPGSRPELFAKALAGDADSISFDVEDSVPEHSKARAREQIADFLRSGAVKRLRQVDHRAHQRARARRISRGI